MSDEQEKATEASEGPAPEPQPEEVPPKDRAQWNYKKTFGINEEMKKVIGLTISATQSEITQLRRKLEKLTYGS